MDSNSEEGEYQHYEDALPQDTVHYKVSYSRGRNTKEVNYDKKEDQNKKRYPVSRSSNNPGRLKRVVSCKRKTHHQTVARRKQTAPGRAYDTANKENEMACAQDVEQEIFYMEPWESAPNVSNNKTGGASSKQTDYFTLAQLSKDHSTITDVLFGRNLRLKVAWTLWRRNVGELLTYILRIQDIGVFVDFLPIITKSISKESPGLSIGCCVDLFPLVQKVLAHPYEEYLIVGLSWIQTVLKNWLGELSASGFRGPIRCPLDKNFQAFNQQLLELWRQEPGLRTAPGSAGDIAKDIDSFLSQLT